MQERMKILEMLQNGIITVDEAEELLKTIDNEKVEVVEDDQVKVITEKEKIVNKNKLRMLKIRVISSQGDNVNINIPASFLKAAVATGNINNLVNKSVNIKGVDQTIIKDSLDIDLLIECIENEFIGNLVDITTAQGDIVQIYFE